MNPPALFPAFKRARVACLMASVLAATAHVTFAAPPPSQSWAAAWITCPSSTPTGYGVYLFRKSLELAAKPASYLVNISADNRYRLYVNGDSVCFGPQRGSQLQWHYDTVNLAPYLKAGRNTVAVRVWNYGDYRPYGIMSVRTGLLVQGDGPDEDAVNTGPGWKVARDHATEVLPVDNKALRTYMTVGPGDHVNGSAYPWGWNSPTFDDSTWEAPSVLENATPRGVGTDVGWWLVPRNIPLMEETPQRLAHVRRTEGIQASDRFLAGDAPLIVPAHSRVSILLDQGFETNAFPQLVVSGGGGSTVTVTYAEALYDDARRKGNRDEIDGKHMIGVRDQYLPDGGRDRTFSTLGFRTFRYVELSIETAAEPLDVDDFHGVFTAYPFKEAASFSSDDPELGRIWTTGWRTARLCAFETYTDCPYYEQMQYVGDTRIQSLISLYVSGDDRLMRNAIDLIDSSRIPEGLTQSRYPSIVPQIINTFSLFWIDMVHDHWMLRGDEAYTRSKLLGITSVLDWFEKRIDPATGMLGPLDYWTFVDWPDDWPWSDVARIGGEPPGSRTGGSSVVSFQLACTLVHAADVCRALGEGWRADRYEAEAKGLRESTLKLCWDEKRGLVADTPKGATFSQHANIMAVLSGAVAGSQAKELMSRVAKDRSITQATLYYRFYLNRAMKEAGLGDDYVSMLQPWRDALAKGMTTFPERGDPTRSDCHAWSASPVYEFLATVCGIEPMSPGFKTVRVAPHLGPLTRIDGTMPHPAGTIEVHLRRDGPRLEGAVTLPAGVSGEFDWRGILVDLHPGLQEIHVTAPAEAAAGPDGLGGQAPGLASLASQ